MTPEERQAAEHTTAQVLIVINNRLDRDEARTKAVEFVEQHSSSWKDELRLMIRAQRFQRCWPDGLRRDAYGSLAIPMPKWCALGESGMRNRVGPELAGFVDGYEGDSVLIMGPTGVGKTWASLLAATRWGIQASAIASSGLPLIEWHAVSATFLRAADLDVFERTHPLGSGRPPALEKAECAPLLILDDLGWEREPRLVASLLDVRYAAALPTIATTGFNTDQLSERYGPAVVRRLMECGGPDGGAAIDLFR